MCITLSGKKYSLNKVRMCLITSFQVRETDVLNSQVKKYSFTCTWICVTTHALLAIIIARPLNARVS